MSKKLYPETDIQNIANAIRNLNGSSDTYTVSQMATAINNIPINTVVEENNIYIKKTIGNFDVEKLNKIIGASVVWNQLVQNGNFANTSNWDTGTGTTFTASNNVAHAEFTQDYRYIGQTISTIENHIYLSVATVRVAQGTMSIILAPSQNISVSSNSFETYSRIFKASGTSVTIYPLRRSTSDSIVIGECKNVMMFDLTAHFGNTAIADYVYYLETAQAGSGIDWLKSYGFFTEEYYAYSTNTIQSVSVSGHKIVGKNQFDSSKATTGKFIKSDGALDNSNGWSVTDYIPVFPNKQYILSGVTNTGNLAHNVYYDSNKNIISTFVSTTQTFTTPSNCAYVRLSLKTTTFDGVQFEFGSTATAYEPYTEETTALDHTTLRGLFKLDANNNLYADGDIYNADGSGSVVMCDLTFDGSNDENWSEQSSGNNVWQIAVSDLPKTTYGLGISNLFLWTTIASNEPDNSIRLNGSGNRLFIIHPTAFNTLEGLRTYLSNNPLRVQYIKATPTTATLTPFNPLSIIEEGGTEEFIDYGVQQSTRDVAIPCGNETTYIKLPI